MAVPDPRLRDLLLDASDAPRFAGVRLISDVHGQAEPFGVALVDAARRDLFVIQLGDLVDRGPSSDGAARLAMDLVEARRGLFLCGNHDDKLRRAVGGNPVRIGDNLRRTLAQLRAAGLAERFAEAVMAAPVWLETPRAFFAHAAFAPGMRGRVAPSRYAHPTLTKEPLVHMALYGETDGTVDAEGEATRTYGWVDDVPDDLTVYIGHDILAAGQVTRLSGRRGGRVVCLDTGAWLTGGVTWLDLDLAALGLAAPSPRSSAGSARSGTP